MRETENKIEKSEKKREDLQDKLKKNVKILSHAEGLAGKVYELNTSYKFEQEKLARYEADYKREKQSVNKIVDASIPELEAKLEVRTKEYEQSGQGIEDIHEAIEKNEKQVTSIERQKTDLHEKKSELQSQVSSSLCLQAM